MLGRETSNQTNKQTNGIIQNSLRNNDCVAFKMQNKEIELALWSRGRVDGSESEGPRFNPHVRTKLFHHILNGCSK